MIPPMHLTHWRTIVPWGQDTQIEQDLVLTRAIIQLYSDPLLASSFAFRGGTAMQKLFFDPPTRYSEDIDLVQLQPGPVGTAIDSIRTLIDPWLGTPQRDRKPGRVTLMYRFESEMPPVQRMRLKIEINTSEHFVVLKPNRLQLRCGSGWFSGNAEILTYEIEELLGTKLRALFQRKKGRDLYDLAMALRYFPKLDLSKTVHCFQRYLEHEKAAVTRAQFEANLAGKLDDEGFCADVLPLLASDAPHFDVKAEGLLVKEKILALLPGEPWKGNGSDKKTKKR